MKDDIERDLNEAIELCGYIGADQSVPPILRGALVKLRKLFVLPSCWECPWVGGSGHWCDHKGAPGGDEGLFEDCDGPPPEWCPIRGKR